MIKECSNCHKELEHHAKGLCYACYKKVNWNPKSGTCRRCKRNLFLHAKGLCPGCYNSTFQIEKNKEYYHRKSKNVDLKTYRLVTKSCVICGFDKIVDIHHIDKNKENHSPKNLVGLCPNHHRMINSFKFRDELIKILGEKGYHVPLKEK